jgi:ABC-type sugar transport system ATPase subunit
VHATSYLELRGVSKRFGGVLALDQISLAIARGGVHGLIGENGAGKSTLGKIIAGEYRADSGAVLLEGEQVQYASPRQALSHGVKYVAQELSIVGSRSIQENVLLGTERCRFGFVDNREGRARYDEIATRLGFDLDPHRRAGTLRIADQQKVELMRALASQARLIVMDEPTAALSPAEADRLLETVRRLAQDGVTVVFVSHFLRDVLAVCDDVTVLKDGRHVMTVPAASTNAEELVRAMIGRDLDVTHPRKRFPPAEAPIVLEVRDLQAAGAPAPTSLHIRRGEILGLAGLVGSGRTEICRALFGLEGRSGDIRLNGAQINVASPIDAIRHGIVMLPESRRDAGLVMRRSIRDNVTLPHLGRFSRLGFIRPKEEQSEVRRILAEVGVSQARNQGNVVNLSGGNQQKVLFAKWLLDVPQVLIADEPTRGVDVGAKRAIYELLVGLAQQGMAILLVSSEIEELLGLAHRVQVLRGGRVVGEVDGGSADKEAVMRVAFGSDAATREAVA